MPNLSIITKQFQDKINDEFEQWIKTHIKRYDFNTSYSSSKGLIFNFFEIDNGGFCKYEDIEQIIKNIQRDNLLLNSQWIPVTDELPEAGKRVIFSTQSFVGEGYMGYRNGELVWYRMTGYVIGEGLMQPVTHWMTMPKSAIGGI